MAGNNTDDYAAHRDTWDSFVRVIIYSCIGIAGVLIWMALFLT